jgi:hypothetical protein
MQICLFAIDKNIPEFETLDTASLVYMLFFVLITLIFSLICFDIQNEKSIF